MNRLPIAIATTCAVAGLGAGTVLNATAAEKPAAKTAKAKKKGAAGKVLKRAVHAELTVPTKDGFKTVTFDRGFVKSVSGDTLVVSESTKKLAGKTVTLTIPSSAKVRVAGKAAQLSDVKAGQHVAVVARPKGTTVNARDAK